MHEINVIVFEIAAILQFLTMMMIFYLSHWTKRFYKHYNIPASSREALHDATWMRSTQRIWEAWIGQVRVWYAWKGLMCHGGEGGLTKLEQWWASISLPLAAPIICSTHWLTGVNLTGQWRGVNNSQSQRVSTQTHRDTQPLWFHKNTFEVSLTQKAIKFPL